MNWSVLLTCGSLTVAIVAQILIGSRNQRKDAENRGREMGVISESLREISKDVSEIRIEQKALSDKAEKRHEEMIERVALVEASTKSAHKRIDSITGTNRSV